MNERDLLKEEQWKHKFLVCFDGLGSTGKTPLLRSLGRLLRQLVPQVQPYQYSEPPKEALGGFSPYEIVTRGLVASEAIGPYLAGIRGMMWDTATRDVLPWGIPTEPKLLIGDRGPMSAFYQGAFPGGDNPWGRDFWKLLYPPELGVPFPDILILIDPDSEEKRLQRLQERVRENGGLTDQFDDPGNQEYFERGYRELASILLKKPGVYQITSGEIRPGLDQLSSANPSLLIALLIVCGMAEKGITAGHSFQADLANTLVRPLRVNAGREVTAYLMDLKYSGLFYGESFSNPGFRYALEHTLTFKSGDLGLFWVATKIQYDPLACVYALESGAKNLPIEEVRRLVTTAIGEGDFIEVDSQSRIGSDLYASRFPEVVRSWGSISW